MVNKVFEVQIGRNVEIYVDMLVKSMKTEKHIDDLEKTLYTLRKFRMKLNPAKCAFKVSASKFIGFMVSHRGNEANLEKVESILGMKAP